MSGKFLLVYSTIIVGYLGCVRKQIVGYLQKKGVKLQKSAINVYHLAKTPDRFAPNFESGWHLIK